VLCPFFFFFKKGSKALALAAQFALLYIFFEQIGTLIAVQNSGLHYQVVCGVAMLPITS